MPCKRRHQLLSNEPVRIELLRELVEKTGGAWVTCIGASMEPTILRGARLRVAATGRPRPGDVILFEAGSHLVTHRVLARIPGPGGPFLVHAGDAGAGTPALVRESRVIGRIQSRRRDIPLPTRLRAAGSAIARALRQRLRRHALVML